MLQIVLTEFLSRGLLWVRVLLIGGFITADEYGYLLLLISAETIFGSIISYPQVKEILVRQHCGRSHFYSTGALYLLLLPFVLATSYWYFEDYVSALIIATSVLFFAAAQTALYVLRVQNAVIYNRAKMHAAVISTVVFFATLPFNQNLLPLTYLSYFVVLLAAFLRVEKRESAGAGFSVRAVVAGWLVFGAQSLLTQLGQQGNRFVVGAVLSVGDVAVFVKSYMLASGITFVYAAVMVKFEKHLSKRIEVGQIRPRGRLAAKVCAVMLVLLGAYGLLGYTLWNTDSDLVAPVFVDARLELYLLFLMFFALQAIYLVLNPVLLAFEKRSLSLLATNASLATQFVILAVYWGALNLQLVAASMLAGQFVLVVFLAYGVYACRRLPQV